MIQPKQPPQPIPNNENQVPQQIKELVHAQKIAEHKRKMGPKQLPGVRKQNKSISFNNYYNNQFIHDLDPVEEIQEILENNSSNHAHNFSNASNNRSQKSGKQSQKSGSSVGKHSGKQSSSGYSGSFPQHIAKGMHGLAKPREVVRPWNSKQK